MDPILPLFSILGYWAIILGSFGGPGGAPKHSHVLRRHRANLRRDRFMAFGSPTSGVLSQISYPEGPETIGLMNLALKTINITLRDLEPQ